MVGSRRYRSAAAGKRVGAPLVGAEAPTRRDRLVDGAANEGMPEAEPSRYLSRAHDVSCQQLVERHEHIRFVSLRGRRRELGLEGFTRDGRGLQDESRLAAQVGELPGQCAHDCRRHSHAGQQPGLTGVDSADLLASA